MSKKLEICVVERFLIVALDIQETLKGWNSAVEFRAFPNISDARAHYIAAGCPDVVVVAGSNDTNIDISKDDMEWLRHQRVIALDQDGEETSNWQKLEKPFSPDQLINAMENLLGDGCMAQTV